MKRTALSLTLVLTLLLSAAAGQLVNLTWADMFIPYPAEPNEDPPTIALQSPHNETYAKNNVTLNFTVTKPDSWTFDMITSINYILDDYEPVVLFKSSSTYTDRLPKETTYSKELTGLDEGLHSLQVNVATNHFFSSENLNVPNIYTAVVSEVAYFTVDTSPPNITIQSPENKTYGKNDISLDFITNEPVSQITYSIDGQENMTISGNITLTGLSRGAHYLTVYAKDAGGIIGASETIHFEIEPFPPILVVASILSAAAICVCLIVYFKKRHK
jgi:hypothetical protein